MMRSRFAIRPRHPHPIAQVLSATGAMARQLLTLTLFFAGMLAFAAMALGFLIAACCLNTTRPSVRGTSHDLTMNDRT